MNQQIKSYKSSSINKSNRNSLTRIQPSSDKDKLPILNFKRHQKALSAYKIINYSMENVKYKAEPLNYISSKIDFFNPQNQRKLDVSKRKIMMDIGIISSPRKQKPITIKHKHSLGPEIQTLINRFLQMKQQRQHEQMNYLVIGSQTKVYIQKPKQQS